MTKKELLNHYLVVVSMTPRRLAISLATSSRVICLGVERNARGRARAGRYESELKGTELRVDYLTAKGAVGIPISYLALALIATAVGIYFFQLDYLEGVIASGVISGLCTTMSVRQLYRTISAIEYAALRPARTVDFEITCGPDKIKLGKESELWINADTDEEDVENFSMNTLLPLELETPEVTAPDLLVRHYPDCISLVYHVGFLPKNFTVGICAPITPKKVGVFPVSVFVYGKGIYSVKKELTVEVTK